MGQNGRHYKGFKTVIEFLVEKEYLANYVCF